MKESAFFLLFLPLSTQGAVDASSTTPGPFIEASNSGGVVINVNSGLEIKCPTTVSSSNPVACIGDGVKVDPSTGACVPQEQAVPCSGQLVEVDAVTGKCVPKAELVSKSWVENKLAEVVSEARVKELIALSSKSGSIEIWPSSTAPIGWLVCNGAAVSRVTYANLFQVIGETYGSGDGANTFNLPDFSGVLPLGASASTEVGDTGGSTATTFTPSGSISASLTGRTENHVLTMAQMPRHNHARGSTTDDWGAGGSRGYVGGDRGGGRNTQPTYNGENQPHSHDLGSSAGVAATFTGSSTTINTVPPHVKILYIIRA